MDVRAFGSVYGQTAALPYASGFMINNGVDKTFPSCRAIYVENNNKTADKILKVSLSDAPGTWITFEHIRTDVLLPISATAISGASTVDHIYVLY